MEMAIVAEILTVEEKFGRTNSRVQWLIYGCLPDAYRLKSHIGPPEVMRDS